MQLLIKHQSAARRRCPPTPSAPPPRGLGGARAPPGPLWTVRACAVVADTIAFAGLGSKDNCATLRDAARLSGTTALQAGTSAMNAANTNAID